MNIFLTPTFKTDERIIFETNDKNFHLKNLHEQGVTLQLFVKTFFDCTFSLGASSCSLWWLLHTRYIYSLENKGINILHYGVRICEHPCQLRSLSSEAKSIIDVILEMLFVL